MQKVVTGMNVAPASFYPVKLYCLTFIITMKKKEIYEELKRNPKNVRFEVLCSAAELFGFRFRGGKGSHRIYVKEGVREMLNFQDVGGKAKPYQVKQFLKIVENYNLLEE